MSCSDHRFRAFTKVELLVVLAIIGGLVLMVIPAQLKSRAFRKRVQCVNNLKNIGLATRIFATGSRWEYPWTVDDPQRSTITHRTNPMALWRHFAALSNELSTPELMICPADRERRAARSWAEFTNNQFVSYALGISATEEQPHSILALDRNLLLGGVPVSNAIISFSSNAVVTFGQRIHANVGTLLFGDGSVQPITSARLDVVFRESFEEAQTNVLAFP